MTKIVYKNAYIYGYGENYDLAIDNGKIVEIGKDLDGEKIVFLTNKLITPRFIDSHTHIDKALMPGDPNSTDLTRANLASLNFIESIPDDKIYQDIYNRCETIIQMALKRGTGCIKTTLLISNKYKMHSIDVLEELKKKYQNKITLLNAVPIEDGFVEEFEKYAEAGKINFIAGYPTLAKDYIKDVDRIFHYALKYNLPIDLHVDESDNPNIDTFLYVLKKTIECNMQGKVTCGHVTALSSPYLPKEKVKEALQLAKEAKMNITTLTSCNIYLMSYERRGPTLVRDMIENNIPVSIGSDNIRDPFRPFGNADLLEEALLTAQIHKLALPKQLEEVFKMITINPALNCLLKDYGIKKGQMADFLVLDAPSIQEAIISKANILFKYINGNKE